MTQKFDVFSVTPLVTLFRSSTPKIQKHKESGDFSVLAAAILIYLNPQRQLQIRFLNPVLGVEESAICEKITPLQ